MDNLKWNGRTFRKRILRWYSENKRDFPWRYTNNPYHVFVSEVLLQQTNAEKVVEPFTKITKRYKSIKTLALAKKSFLFDIFLKIGLFFRAERLIQSSRQILDEYSGIIPSKRDDLIKIYGVGDYICNAVLCFGYGQQYAVVDTNVIRILTRIFGIKSVKARPRADKFIWLSAQLLLPKKDFVDYNYALLDFASLVCKNKNPLCVACPMKTICIFFKLQSILD